VLIEPKKVNHSSSQLLELLRPRSLLITLLIKNIFQLMETKISTRVLEEFSSDGIMLMLAAEELLLLKHFQELVHLELLVSSLPNTNLLQFTSLIQHGEITTPSLPSAVSTLESIDISIKKLRDSILMV
jgi:hypothetical protein